MRIHCLLHSDLGGETHLPVWAAGRGHIWTTSIVPSAPRLPTVEEVDCLAVMGGPMSAWDDRKHPWLVAEKRLLEDFLHADKPILAICLGAQLIAGLLGARTYPGQYTEIGWFPVHTTPASRNHPVAGVLPAQFETFLWHEDSFDIPDGSLHIASSPAYESQAFLWNRVLALQFHLEVSPDWVRRLARRDGDQLAEGSYTQSVGSVLSKSNSVYQANNSLMERLLDRWLAWMGERHGGERETDSIPPRLVES